VPILNTSPTSRSTANHRDGPGRDRARLPLGRRIGSGLENLQSQLVGLPATIAVMQIVIAQSCRRSWMEMNRPSRPPTHRDRRYDSCAGISRASSRVTLQHAKSANQKAFAFGWLSHVSSSVTAEPFVNNVVGGPYRTHCAQSPGGQLRGLVDVGFFEQNPLPTMAGTTDARIRRSEHRRRWPSICEANLQNSSTWRPGRHPPRTAFRTR